MEDIEIINHNNINKFASLESYAKENNISEFLDFSLHNLKNEKRACSKNIITYKHNQNIIDFCYIEYEEDIKLAKVYLPKLMKNRSKLIKGVIDYSISSKDINDLFINADKNDKYLINALVENNFLPLIPNDDGTIPYYFEREKMVNAKKVM